MNPPSNRQIEVATEALRSEAGTWDAQSEIMASIASNAEGLRLTRLEAGMFQLIVDPYNAVVDQISGRSSEGKEQMSNIADTLRDVARTYEEEEAENVHELRNAY